MGAQVAFSMGMLGLKFGNISSPASAIGNLLNITLELSPSLRLLRHPLRAGIKMLYSDSGLSLVRWAFAL